ncbi:MAG: phosphocholine cytidylyltransferase family protein [Rhodovibrionaceae bacterium]|nr:phosphocholine cytidylyltransferase family protein [Rhodovibrionaceae bacterium]
MKALILSAGQGSRLLPLTKDRPKCLLPLGNGRTILEWQIAELAEAGVTEAVVITGFRSEEVEAHLADVSIPSLRLTSLFNPFFQVADNLGTCWMARHEMDGDFLLLNGDTVFEAGIARKLIAEARAPITVTIDQKPSYDADDMKVRLDGERLTAIGKGLSHEETHAESIGMLLFRGDGPKLFRDTLETAMRTPEGLRWWYLKAIDRLARQNHVGTVSVDGMDWGEVDYPADLEAAQHMVASWQRQEPGTRPAARIRSVS